MSNAMDTKHCLRCGSDALVSLVSLNTKKCGDCAHEQHWPLDPGQKPMWGRVTAEEIRTEKIPPMFSKEDLLAIEPQLDALIDKLKKLLEARNAKG